jgi:hypothetical protein
MAQALAMQQVSIPVLSPRDLLAFARACADSDDISECVVLALQLLRSDIEDLAQRLAETH